MTIKNININGLLENIIQSLSIKNGKKTYLKNQIKYLFKNLKNTSLNYFEAPRNSIQRLSNAMGLVRFWYCGSYDRGVCIDTEFDIDIDIVYDKHPNNSFKLNFNQKSLTGEKLFTILYEDLLDFQEKINSQLNIAKNPPFRHAIPVSLGYQNQTLKVDCIPTIELPNGFLIVPDGWDDVKKVNQKLEEQGLSKVNKKTNGNSTKLIWLLKYWNWYWNKPMKSYVIQRLVEEIFLKYKIKGWDNAVKVFFQRSIGIFNRYYNDNHVLKDRVYPQHSILDDYGEKQIENFYNALQEAQDYVSRGEWNELFGND